MYMDISRLGKNETVKFAYNELCRYLRMIAPTLLIKEGVAKEYKADASKLWVGISSEFDGYLPKVEDPKLDDGIYIDVKNGAGIITGTNPRSVLIAVYRFLKELGVSWVRPGADGEILPEKLPSEYEVNICEAASYRHRAVCIEGSVSYEHVKNVIDWIPKASMNGYYIQFRVPFTFFDRWYNHIDNPNLKPEGITYEDVAGIMCRIEEEIELRGLMYHTVGHGWTCEPFGIKGLGWDKVEDDLPDEIREKLALVDGKRGLWKGVPLNTSLCYSNPEVRELMSDSVLEYCKNNPQADYVHVWLADGVNNNCECEECKKKMPSEYYVMILNDIDRKLTNAGMDTKVVFLMYLDLLWVFNEGEIKNPDRFLMMFAPITRSYTKCFTDFDETEKVELAPYVRNKLRLPNRVEENVAYLRSWQEKFHGDSVDFDYHLMWDHVYDPGYYRCAEVMHGDVKGLDKIGLNGFISCQLQRASLPTGLPMEMMARGLWDKNSDFESGAKEFFAAAFGKDSEKAREYLKTLSELFVPPFMRGEMGEKSEEAVANYEKIDGFVKSFLPVIEENIAATEGNISRSWEYLMSHAKLLAPYADMLISAAKGNVEEMFEKSKTLFARACEIEWEVHNVFESYEFAISINRFFRRTFNVGPDETLG